MLYVQVNTLSRPYLSKDFCFTCHAIEKTQKKSNHERSIIHLTRRRPQESRSSTLIVADALCRGTQGLSP